MERNKCEGERFSRDIYFLALFIFLFILSFFRFVTIFLFLSIPKPLNRYILFKVIGQLVILSDCFLGRYIPPPPTNSLCHLCHPTRLFLFGLPFFLLPLLFLALTLLAFILPRTQDYLTLGTLYSKAFSTIFCSRRDDKRDKSRFRNV